MRWTGRGALLALPLVLGAISACQILSGLDELSPDRGPESATSSGGGSVGSGGAGGAGGASSSSSGSSSVGSSSSASSGGGAGGGGPALGCTASKCPVVLIDDTMSSVDLLAVTPLYLVWAQKKNADMTTGSIWQAFVDGTNVSTVATAGIVEGLAAASTFALWVSQGSATDDIMMSTLGAQPKVDTLAQEALSSVTAMSFFNGDVHWAETINVKKIRRVQPAPGNMPMDDVAIGDAAPRELASNGQGFFWNGLDAGVYAIKRFQMGVTIDIGPSSADTVGLIHVQSAQPPEGYIYWTESVGTMGGKVMRAPAGGQNMAGEVVVSKLTYPTFLAANATSLYWVEADANPCVSTAQIRMRSLNPLMEDVYTLAKDIPCPSNLVTSNGYLYFGSGMKIYHVKE